MKRVVFWALWAVVPVSALAFHLGPGQRLQQRDDVAVHIAAAETAASQENWQLAGEEYMKARGLLPDQEHAARARLQFLEAGTKLEGGDLVAAGEEFADLLAREEATPAADPKLVAKLREQIGQTSYYTAWTMRMEGASETEWREESTVARQQFRYLAEAGSEEELKKPSSENLEAVIRFEHMDDAEFKAMKRPKKCEGASNCSQKKREQRMSKNPGKKPSDARDQIKKDTSSNAVNQGSGS